jgi:hypothetical protein
MTVVPAALQPYLKFVVGVVGAIVTSLLGVLPQPPHWLVVASSVLTALAVYVVPNGQVAPSGTEAAGDAPDQAPAS